MAAINAIVEARRQASAYARLAWSLAVLAPILERSGCSAELFEHSGPGVLFRTDSVQVAEEIMRVVGIDIGLTYSGCSAYLKADVLHGGIQWEFSVKTVRPLHFEDCTWKKRKHTTYSYTASLEWCGATMVSAVYHSNTNKTKAMRDLWNRLIKDKHKGESYCFIPSLPFRVSENT